MNLIELVFKGIIIGLGKIIPGVSGSLIAITLGVYEEAIKCVTSLFKNFKYSISFLGSLGLGAIISIIFGSKLIMYSLNNFYFPTMLLFIGFIVGVVPNIYKKCNIKKDYLFLIISILIVVIISFASSSLNFIPRSNFKSYLTIISIGFIDATTMIIPGISGTAIFMILGYYNFILELFSNLVNVNYIIYWIMFGVGLIMGIFLVSYFINYMFNKHYNKTYMLILGFTCSSIFILIKKAFNYSSNIVEIIVGIILLFIGYKVSKILSKE